MDIFNIALASIVVVILFFIGMALSQWVQWRRKRAAISRTVAVAYKTEWTTGQYIAPPRRVEIQQNDQRSSDTLTGAVIGGTTGGVEGMLVGAMLGGVAGGVIGGMIAESNSTPQPEPEKFQGFGGGESGGGGASGSWEPADNSSSSTESGSSYDSSSSSSCDSSGW